MKIKFATFIIAILTVRTFALSLGDSVNTATLEAETTPQSTMKLSKIVQNHKEYTFKNANGSNIILVNKNGQVYGFQWHEKITNLADMLGNKYKAQFDAAYRDRPNKFNHRALIIDTPDLTVRQFGMPDGPFEGTMIAKNLAPE